jgi:hypothetical protein
MGQPMSPGKICLRSQQLTTTGTVSMAAHNYSTEQVLFPGQLTTTGTVSMAAHNYRTEQVLFPWQLTTTVQNRYCFHGSSQLQVQVLFPWQLTTTGTVSMAAHNYSTEQVLFPRQLTTVLQVSFPCHAANNYSIGTVPKRRITDDRNDAEVMSAMLPISVRYLCQKYKFRGDLSL